MERAVFAEAPVSGDRLSERIRHVTCEGILTTGVKLFRQGPDAIRESLEEVAEFTTQFRGNPYQFKCLASLGNCLMAC